VAEIKSLSAIREKWERVTPGRTEDYKLGIQQPRRDWATQASAAKDTYKAAIDAAHAKNMYQKGVEEAGTKKWQDRAIKKGPGRFAEGVMISAPDYEKGFAPYRQAIEAVDLGQKYPRRDPRNLDRVKRVVEALVAQKVGR